MDGLGLPAGRLLHALGRAPRGGAQHDPQALLSQDRDDSVEQRGLPGPRPSGDHEDPAPHGPADRLALAPGEGQPLRVLHPCDRAFHVHPDPGRPGGEQARQPIGRVDLGGVEGGQEDGLPGGQVFEDQALRSCKLPDGLLDHKAIDSQDLLGLLDEAHARGVDVPLVGLLAKRVEHAGRGTPGRVGGDAQPGRDPVGALESDAVDLLGEAVGIFPDRRDGAAAVGLVDLDGVCGGDPVGLEKDHHVLDLSLFRPRLADRLGPDRSDPLHFGEAILFALDDVQRLQAEVLDQPGRHDGSDPLDQARGQVFFDPRQGGRLDGDVGFHPELLAVPPVLNPPAPEPQVLSGLNAEEVAHGRDRARPAGDREAHHAPGALFIAVDEPLQGPLQGGE